jgi:hypothetical protein
MSDGVRQNNFPRNMHTVIYSSSGKPLKVELPRQRTSLCVWRLDRPVRIEVVLPMLNFEAFKSKLLLSNTCRGGITIQDVGMSYGRSRAIVGRAETAGYTEAYENP